MPKIRLGTMLRTVPPLRPSNLESGNGNNGTSTVTGTPRGLAAIPLLCVKNRPRGIPPGLPSSTLANLLRIGLVGTTRSLVRNARDRVGVARMNRPWRKEKRYHPSKYQTERERTNLSLREGK
jgi:hypothetical protein